jgi:4'-phosphopantetheinyl transferase
VRDAPDEDEVRIFLVRLDETTARTSSALWTALDAEERGRARSLATVPLFEAFVVAHGVLRVVLGDALGVGAEAVRFRRGAFGKPSLAPPAGETLRFNLAHSPTLAAVAVARRREVGVDVEDVRPVVGAMEIAARHFGPGDVATLAGAGPDRFAREFLQLWTRRESSLKALGIGLSDDPDALPGRTDSRRSPQRAFETADLALGRDHVGALTVERGAGIRTAAWRVVVGDRRVARHPFAFERADVTASARLPG